MTPRMRPLLLTGLLTCLLLGAARPAGAEEAIVFRCTDEQGAVTVRDRPCPSGQAQIIQRRGASADATTTTALGEAPAAAVLDSRAPPTAPAMDVEGGAEGLLDSDVLRAQEAARLAEGPPRPPLPEIYRCVSREGSQYLHEREPAPPRCADLSISGLGGSVAPDNAASCEVVRDACEALTLEQRCGAWQQRLRDARGRERFALPENQIEAANERLRIEAVLGASNCPVP